MEHTADCAEAIVNGACRGDRYVIEPTWYRVLLLYKVLCPEVVEWFYRIKYPTISKPLDKRSNSLSKKLVDLTGAKNFMYPSSLRHQPEVADTKTE